MKPLDQFVQKMMESARLVRSQDPAGAADVIQRALQQAGLATPDFAAPDFAVPDFAMPDFAMPGAANAKAVPDFIDINPAPRKPGRKGPLPKARAWKRPAAVPADLGPGRFIDGSYACAAGQRRYKLYIPARAANGPRPLVVMLHGCTQNAVDFAAGTGMNTMAEEHGCLVLYPEQERGANPNNCWNWFDAAQQRRDEGEPSILAGMTREVAREHGADAKRVFVAGLSAGGAMAAILGAEYPELYTAVGVHSGLAAGTGKDMISGLHAMKRPPGAAALDVAVPIIVFHGDADHVVHPGNGDAVLRQYAKAHGALQEDASRGEAAGRGYTRTSWRDAGGRRLAEHWVVHGAAHAWMGGRPAGSHTDAKGPCASKEMLAFFLEQN